jgi:hypothetical protein
MRRPTNEFVPAVGGERLSRTSITAALPEPTEEGGVGLQTDVGQEKDPKGLRGTNGEPISLLEKASCHSSRSPVNTVSLRRKKNILAKTMTADEDDNDTLQTEMSSGTSPRPNCSVENSKPGGCEDQNMIRVSYAGRNDEFDPQSTSDTDFPQRHVVAKESELASGRGRHPRRHSSHLKTSTQHTQCEIRIDLHSSQELSTSGASSEVSTATTRAENADTDIAALDEETSSNSKAIVGGRLKRGQRAVARRKSMML